jgi:hypothetical protein
MIPFLATSGYLAVQFLLFLGVVRHLPWGRTERGILFFQCAAYGFLLTLISIGSTVLPPDPLLVFAAGLHGIYSLSFLELWSLTQGSYSLGILAQIDRLGGAALPSDLAGQTDIGRQKQHQRYQSLVSLGLLRTDGQLTARGWIAAHTLRCVASLSNSRKLN